jgi:hypothetical protein
VVGQQAHVVGVGEVVPGAPPASRRARMKASPNRWGAVSSVRPAFRDTLTPTSGECQ